MGEIAMNNIPRPLFCVGEEVAVVAVYYPEWNTGKIEIVNMHYKEGFIKRSGVLKTVWWYELADNANWWAAETALRKLPPQKRTSWEDCIFQPNLIAVGAE